jgi:glycosyltransferase involved in cell wall biosynthesis
MEASQPAKPRDRRGLHVVMVIQRFRPYFSGQGVQLEELARALVRRGAEVTVVAAVRGRDAPRDERRDGVSIRRLRCDLPGRADSGWRRRLWSPTFALRTFFHLLGRGARPDLVHVHGANDALYAAWAFGRLARVPVLFEMTLMGVDDPATIRASQNRFASLRRGIYRRCDGYVAMSPALAEAYLAAGLPESKLRMIPQGVDVETYRPPSDRAGLRRELGADGDGPVVVFLGSLIERKGIDVLLSAWERIHRARPAASLWLVGRDRFEDDPGAGRFLERCFASLPASALARVRRFGVRDDPARLLQAADVFVFPSRREGFGTAIIEAMACALPSVVAELRGITDYIFAPAGAAGAASGVVVAQADAAALADAVLALLADGARAAAIGAAARQRACERFAIGRIAEEYLAWYGEVIGARSVASPGGAGPPSHGSEATAGGGAS